MNNGYCLDVPSFLESFSKKRFDLTSMLRDYFEACFRVSPEDRKQFESQIRKTISNLFSRVMKKELDELMFPWRPSFGGSSGSFDCSMVIMEDEFEAFIENLESSQWRPDASSYNKTPTYKKSVVVRGLDYSKPWNAYCHITKSFNQYFIIFSIGPGASIV